MLLTLSCRQPTIDLSLGAPKAKASLERKRAKAAEEERQRAKVAKEKKEGKKEGKGRGRK